MTVEDERPLIELEGVTKRYPNLTAVDDLSISIAKNELICFLGPSGSGKTTTLNMIAGLESPTSGDVRIEGERMNGTPARDRDVGLVFQNLALFERLPVRENLGFASLVSDASAEERERMVDDLVDTVDLDPGLLDRNVGDLTPSQRQRVALGRAIAAEPSVLLLDEPMSNLDREEALDMRAEVKRLQDRLGQTMIYVTHDQAEAMSMADRIMVIHEGELQQFATPTDLYERPANRFVAGFIGSPSMNFLQAAREGDVVRILDGTIPVESVVAVSGTWNPEDVPERFEVGIRPEHLTLTQRDHQLGLTATFEGQEPLGPKTIVYVQSDEGTLTIVTPDRPDIEAGDEVAIGVEAENLYPIDPETQEVVY